MSDTTKKPETKPAPAKVQEAKAPPAKVQEVTHATVREAAAEAAAAAVEAMMPAFAAAVRTKEPAAQPTPHAATAKRAPAMCPDCHQHLAACKGQHEAIIVWTKEQRFMDWFDGVDINGVNYISPNRSTKILVPAAAASEILAKVQGYEQNEMDNRLGRKAIHDSGSVDNPKRTTAADGWR